jgi:hypothetical protein
MRRRAPRRVDGPAWKTLRAGVYRITGKDATTGGMPLRRNWGYRWVTCTTLGMSLLNPFNCNGLIFVKSGQCDTKVVQHQNQGSIE